MYSYLGQAARSRAVYTYGSFSSRVGCFASVTGRMSQSLAHGYFLPELSVPGAPPSPQNVCVSGYIWPYRIFSRPTEVGSSQ